MDQGPGYQISSRAQLRWKRGDALEADLLQALELTPNQACAEVGFNGICFGLVHLVTLGGNDPVGAGMYAPIAAPSVTTPVATERVTVAACGARVDLDSAGSPAVFTALDLDLDTVDDNTPGIDETIQSLYRRFHARDPSAAETAAAHGLLADVGGTPPSAREFAKMACIAIGTTTEASFQ